MDLAVVAEGDNDKNYNDPRKHLAAYSSEKSLIILSFSYRHAACSRFLADSG
jgi:hypothetical protein